MMILTIALLAAASADTAASAQRSALSKCLKEAVATAKSAEVETAAFEAYMREQCAAPEAALRKAVIAIDMKNGISRKDAAESAQLDVDDYFLSTGDRYESEVNAALPRAQAQAKAETTQPLQQQ